MNATWNVSIRAAALLVLLLPGCTDPETPQYTNKLDRRSPQYVPSPPTKLSVSGLTERNRVFQWQRNSLGEQGFRLERKLGQLGIYTFVCEVPGGTLSYTDTTSMIADTDYTYRILAFAADGLTSAFDSVTVRLLFPAPYDVHVVSNSGDFVRVQWMDSSAEHAGYVVERRTRTTDYRAIATLPPDTMWCTDADLDTTQDYEYRVKAVTGLNASGYSSTSGVMFIPASVDPSLQGQIATSFSAVDDDGVLFVTNTSSGSCSLFNVLTNQVGWSSSQFSLAQAAFSRNGAFLTGRSPDGLVRVIQTSDGNQLQAIPVSSNVNILQLVISDDGKMVAGHDGRNIWGWDTDVGTVVFEVVRTDMGIQSIDLSPDGSTIASAMGTMVKFWNIQTYIQPGRITSAHGQISSVRYGPGNTLFTVEQNAIEFWDYTSYRLLGTASGNWSATSGGSLDATGRHFILNYTSSGSSSPSLGVWRVSDGIWLRDLPLAPQEEGTSWIGAPKRFPERDVIETVDSQGRVFYRTLTYIWGQHDL